MKETSEEKEKMNSRHWKSSRKAKICGNQLGRQETWDSAQDMELQKNNKRKICAGMRDFDILKHMYMRKTILIYVRNIWKSMIYKGRKEKEDELTPCNMKATNRRRRHIYVIWNINIYMYVWHHSGMSSYHLSSSATISYLPYDSMAPTMYNKYMYMLQQ